MDEKILKQASTDPPAIDGQSTEEAGMTRRLPNKMVVCSIGKKTMRSDTFGEAGLQKGSFLSDILHSWRNLINKHPAYGSGACKEAQTYEAIT